MTENHQDGVASPKRVQGAPSADLQREIVTLDTNKLIERFATERGMNNFARLLGIIYGLLVIPLILFLPQVAAGISSILHLRLLSMQPVPNWFPLRILAFFLLSGACFLLLICPIYWYQQFLVPRHRDHLAVTGISCLQSLVKTFLLLAQTVLWRYWTVFIFLEIVFLLKAIQPQWWWIWAWFIYMLFSLFAASYGILLAFSPGSHMSPLDHQSDLFKRLTALTARLHVSIRAILVIQVSDRIRQANAYALGWGRRRMVVLTDTLIQNLPPEEVEVVMAHELGHLVHYHFWKRLLIKSLGMLGLLLALYALPLADVILFLIVVGTGFLYLYRTASRRMEFQADEFALLVTGDALVFKNAKTRLTNLNMNDVGRSPFGTHPSLAERLWHADEFALQRDNPS